MSDRRGKAIVTPEFEEEQRRAEEALEQQRRAEERAEEARRAEVLRRRIAVEPIPPEVLAAQARLDAEFQVFPPTPPFPPTDPSLPQGSMHTSDIADLFLDEPGSSSSQPDREEAQSSAARMPEPLVRLRRGRREASGSGLTVRVRSTYYFICFTYFKFIFLFYINRILL